MRSPQLFTTTTESGAEIFRPLRRRPLTLHSGQRASRAEARPVVEASPLHSVETLAATLFVISMAACWIAVASTATAPLLAAGELLSRAAKSPEKRF